jgi:hypothetical protein
MDLPKGSAETISAEEPRGALKGAGSQAGESVDGEWAGAGLVALALAAGVFNCLAMPILRGASGDSGSGLFFGPIVVGVLLGQFGAMALWLVWGEGPFLRRLALHWVVGLLLLCGFFLGLVVAMFDAGPMSESWWRDFAMLLCVVPAFSLAAQLPLWPLRTDFGWSVERVGGNTAVKKPVGLSISDILCGTAVVAVSLGLVRAGPNASGEFSVYFAEIGMTLAVIFVASLICLVPATLFALRIKEDLVGIGLFAGYALLPVISLLVVSLSVGGSALPVEVFFAVFFGSIIFAAMVASPLWVLRACGYRLVWPRDRRGGKTVRDG